VVCADGLPNDQASREELIELLDEPSLSALEALDQEFFTYPDNLTDLLFEFVRSHPKTFGPVR
jgi:hypothetical protein